MSLSSYSAGLLIDHSVSVAKVAMGVGLIMLIPAAIWAYALTRALREPSNR